MKNVAGYIQRKTMLYKTGVEYGDYTMNHVLGCAHGCKFTCYAYLQKQRFGQVTSYENWLEPYLVSNTLELLDKEIKELQGEKVEKITPTIVDINTTAYIPDEWVGSCEQKMIEYKQIVKLIQNN